MHYEAKEIMVRFPIFEYDYIIEAMRMSVYTILIFPSKTGNDFCSLPLIYKCCPLNIMIPINTVYTKKVVYPILHESIQLYPY